MSCEIVIRNNNLSQKEQLVLRAPLQLCVGYYYKTP
jgi:hypothetical protein